MDEYPGFPNPDLNQQPEQSAGFPKARVQAPCPGCFANTVVLLAGQDVLTGLLKPKNVGSCQLHIVFYDSSGTFIGAYDFDPGEVWDDLLTFPSNTDVVRLGCAVGCSGTAILEYQDQNIS
jgi:hypothetical protein